MSEQIKSRIELLEKEKQAIIDQINACPAIMRVHQLNGAIAELQQMLPENERPKPAPEPPVVEPGKVIPITRKKRLGGKS